MSMSVEMSEKMSQDQVMVLMAEYHNPSTAEKRKTEIRDRLVLAHQNLVRKSVARLVGRFCAGFEDLVQEAQTKLLQQFHCYRTDYRFATFVSRRVKWAVIAHLRGSAVVPLPSGKRYSALISACLKARKRSSITLQEVTRLADETGFSVAEVQRLVATLERGSVSIHATLGGDALGLEDRLVDTAEAPDALLESDEAVQLYRAAMRKAQQQLKPRDWDIFVRCIGREGHSLDTVYDELNARYNIGKERMRQIANKVSIRVRRLLQELQQAQDQWQPA